MEGLPLLQEFAITVTIGLEFSLTRMRHIARHVIVGCSLQVGLTAAAVTGIAILLGQRPASAVLYGDVTSGEALEHARLEHARALVLLINDPLAARRAVNAARHHAPATPIIMRTRYVAEKEEAFSLGASDVICEELESGVEAVAQSPLSYSGNNSTLPCTPLAPWGWIGAPSRENNGEWMVPMAA